MKVSIITTTYNSASTIRDTLESVNAQTYPEIEHIIVDGKSKDNTLDLVKQYGKRISKIISEPDNGIYDAMNKGIRAATGDVIGILNSDDFYANNSIIEKIVDTIECTKCDSLFGNLDFVSAKNPTKIIRHWKSSPFTQGSFIKGWHPPHPTFFVRREIYDKYGGFDTAFEVSADFELMLRFLEQHKISTYFLDETIVKMRYGGESTGSIKKIISGNRNILKAFEKNGIKVSPFYTINRFANKAIQYLK